jgi:hypothetical protein
MRILHRGCQLDLLVEVCGPAAAAASEQRFLCSVSVFLSILQHNLTDCGSMPCFICLYFLYCMYICVCLFFSGQFRRLDGIGCTAFLHDE